MRHGKRSQPPSAPGTALADRAFCSSLWPKDLRPRKSCAWRAFFLLLLLLLSFILSLLSEGKMDWGLFLHCAALTFTLARAPRSGKCHGGGDDFGSQPGEPRAGDGARRSRGRPRPAPGSGELCARGRSRRGPSPGAPGRVRPPTLFSALWGRRIKRGARSRKLRTANYLCSGSSHKQLNKSRLRYLRNNEYLERKALSSPFLFFFFSKA